MAKQAVEIDGRDFSTLQEFYEVFYDAAGIQHITYDEGWFPNLDNFDSHVSGGGWIDHRGLVIRWENSDVSRERARLPRDGAGVGTAADLLSPAQPRCGPRRPTAGERRRRADGL